MPIGRRRLAPPTVALVGTGTISAAHAAAAVLSGFPVSHADLRDGIVGTDIVVVCTPPRCRADDVLALLPTGAAVMVETPMCCTLDEADAMVAASDAHGGRLLYAEHLAHSPVVHRLLGLVPTIGTLMHLEVRALQGLPSDSARTTGEWGGGVLFDLGVHPLAVAMLCANASGAGAPVAVSATMRGRREVDEHAEVMLHFATGLQARVSASWEAGPSPVWDAQLASDRGVLRAELMPVPTLEHDGEQVTLSPARVSPPEIEHYGYLGEMQAIAATIGRSEPPVMTARFGRLVLDTVCAASRSAAHNGAREQLPFTGARDRTPVELWRGR